MDIICGRQVLSLGLYKNILRGEAGEFLEKLEIGMHVLGEDSASHVSVCLLQKSHRLILEVFTRFFDRAPSRQIH